MFLTRWLTSESRTHKGAVNRPRFRPTVESLEAREVPAIFTVTTTADVIDPNDGVLSLREAVLQANATNGTDQIVLSAGTYSLTREGRFEDAGLTGDLDIFGNVTLRGYGAGVTVIQANGLDRAIELHSATVVISDMTIRGGATDFYGFGGGLAASNSTLGMNNCTVENSQAWWGGAIYSQGGTLSIDHSTLSDNVGLASGGGVYVQDCKLTLDRSTVSDNFSNYFGGGVYLSNGVETIKSSTIANNYAFFGGGIWAEGASVTVKGNEITGNMAGYGGGLGMYSSDATVAQCSFRDNVATDRFGGYYQGGGYGGGIFNYVGSSVTVNDCTLANNTAVAGGGISNFFGSSATVNNSTLTGNSAASGGGISNTATMTIRSSTISNNTATGGAFTGNGGGIDNFTGVLQIHGCTLSGNSAAAAGGAIYNGGGLFDGGTLTVRDSTVSGNSATQGGGIYNWAGSSATIQNSTLSGNSASQGGGIYNATFEYDIIYSGTLTLRDSTVVGNIAPLGGDLYNDGVVYLYDSTVGDRYDG